MIRYQIGCGGGETIGDNDNVKACFNPESISQSLNVDEEWQSMVLADTCWKAEVRMAGGGDRQLSISTPLLNY